MYVPLSIDMDSGLGPSREPAGAFERARETLDCDAAPCQIGNCSVTVPQMWHYLPASRCIKELP